MIGRQVDEDTNVLPIAAGVTALVFWDRDPRRRL